MPLLVLWAKGIDLLHQGSEREAEVQWAKGVPLLDTTTGFDDLSVIVEEHRLLAVTPVCPVRQPGELLDCGPHEDLTIHAIERVAKVDLQ